MVTRSQASRGGRQPRLGGVRKVGRRRVRAPRYRRAVSLPLHSRRSSSAVGRTSSQRTIPYGSTSRTRSRTYRDPNQYRQLETLTAKYGRRDRRATYINKLIRSSYNYTKYVLRYYARDNDGGAADGGLPQPLGLELVGGVNFLPILVFNLTTIPQQTASSARQVPSSWRMTQNPSNGVVGFTGVGELNNNNTIGLGWQEYINMGTTSNVGNTSATRRALMEYVNMRFRIRGPTARPTRVVVQLVQPYAWFLGMPEELPLTAGAITRMHYQPWVNMAARCTANPCQNIPSGNRQPWKVLRSKVYEIQPTSTTETDANGHDVVQKWFWRCNRVMNYDDMGWVNTDNPDATDLNIGDGTAPETNVSNYVGLGKRVYMIVSAYAPNSAGAFTPAIHPSFEFSFEKKLSSLTGQSN